MNEFCPVCNARIQTTNGKCYKCGYLPNYVTDRELDVAEEALRLAIKRADISYFKCNYTKLCDFRTYECGGEECINIIMGAYKQEAEERLKKIGGKQ